MYDPVLLSKKIESIVCNGNRRKYYRFRSAGFYGGIATADCVGCCIRCRFCWALHVTDRPKSIGHFYSPRQVAERLVRIARKKGFRQVRMSGNEPTIGRSHLLQVLQAIPQGLLFILETNGILIGADPDYAKALARYPNLEVRVSLKGSNSEEFQRLTAAKPEGFDLQVGALEHLLESGVPCYPAVMASFSSSKTLEALRLRLANLRADFYDLEVEEVVCYPRVQEELNRVGLIPHDVMQGSWE
ncbi:MAG: radical SAM protein [Proteobacteria bacterium]|nr:radical SAM protein [Pseudomonadota bacterium]NIS70328.1 radical SAM protein [Pseudomonadota bacterium]